MGSRFIPVGLGMKANGNIIWRRVMEGLLDQMVLFTLGSGTMTCSMEKVLRS